MLANEVVQVEHARLEHLLPAEGEQLPRERRGALRRALDLRGVALPLGSGERLAEESSA